MELQINGVAVSPGISIGKAYVMKKNEIESFVGDLLSDFRNSSHEQMPNSALRSVVNQSQGANGCNNFLEN